MAGRLGQTLRHLCETNHGARRGASGRKRSAFKEMVPQEGLEPPTPSLRISWSLISRSCCCIPDASKLQQFKPFLVYHNILELPELLKRWFLGGSATLVVPGGQVG